MLKLYKKITNILVDPETDLKTNGRLKILYFLTFFSICGSFLNIFLFYSNNEYYLSKVSAIYTIIYSIPLIFSYFKQYTCTQFSFILAQNIVLFSLSCMLGKEVSIHFGFVVPLILSFVFFKSDKSIYRTLGALFSILSYLSLEILDFKMFEKVYINIEIISISQYVILLVIFIILVLILNSYTKFSEKAEDELSKHKDNLEKIVKERTILLENANKQLELLNSSLEEIVSRRTKELQDHIKNKDIFLSILAHDLRSPFNNIIGFSKILSKNHENLSKPEIEKFSSIIYETSNSTLNLLDDLLLWGKSQTGSITLNKNMYSSSLLLKELLPFFKLNAGAKNIKINLIENENINLYVDVNIIKTVLRNLISNAIKFTQKNGEITIKVVKENQNIKISVADNGVGISAEKQEKIWKISEFYSTIGTDNEKGSGFGLSMCKELIEQHNGTIWLESEVNKGSIFIFTIPIENQ